ncbi:YciI family protein [Pseudorhodoferax sp.]|uniref:YciI family protein n=1 Tax=Pseudorhodoferax sp. TaxID=1993553 RepID=UPI002DD6B256|nr:YciI family protein [Pseudorhodoferax sp.]
MTTVYFAIQTTDKPGHAHIRADVRPAHLQYLKAHVHRFVAAGALLEDDGSPGTGGILLIAATDRADAERFAAEDPYTLAGLFETVKVTRWRKAFFDGQCLV